MSDLRVSLTLQLKNLLGRGLSQVKGDLKGLKDEAKGLGTIKGPNTSGLAQYGQRAREASTALRQLKRDQEALGRGGPRPGSNTVLAGTGRTALAMGGIYGGVQAARGAVSVTVGQAVTFEKAMAQVRKKVDTDEAGFQQLEGTINRTASSFGIARAQVAELVAEAGAAGIAFADLERFMQLTAKAAVAWDMSAPEAAQKLAEIKSGTQMTIGQLETLGEKINGLGDNSAAKERDIIEMFSRAGAAAKAAGVSFDVSLAALTAVRSTGLQPEIASRWFSAFTGGLATIEEGKDKAKEGLKALGMDSKKVAEGMKRDALGTMLEIFDKLTKSPDAASAAIKIFGKEWWDETSRAAQALPELKKQLEYLQSQKWQGSLNKTLNIELATTANHLERFKALVSEIGDRMGRWALPPLNSTIDAIIKKYDELKERLEAKPPKPDPSENPQWADGQDPSQAGDIKAMRKALGKPGSAVTEFFFGKKLTNDPMRERAHMMGQEAGDAEGVGKKQMGEAEILRIQAHNAKNKKDRARLTMEAAKKEAEGLENLARADRTRRAAGLAAARDMSRVEAGEQNLPSGKLTPSVNESTATARTAEIASLKNQIAALESRLTHSPAGGAFMSGPQRLEAAARRSGLEAELESLKAKLREVEGQAGQTGAVVKDKLTMDMTGAGQQVGATYAAGISSGTQAAVAAAAGMASAVRATLSTPAAAPAGGGGAPAGGGGGGAKTTVIKTGAINVHGAGDPEATARAVSRRLASAVREGLGGAHHDGVT